MYAVCDGARVGMRGLPCGLSLSWKAYLFAFSTGRRMDSTSSTVLTLCSMILTLR